MEFPPYPNDDEDREALNNLQTENQELHAAVKRAIALIMQGAHTEARLTLENFTSGEASEAQTESVIERVATWLERKGNYFALNRNIGPYSTELAAALRDGSWETDPVTADNPVKSFGNQA